MEKELFIVWLHSIPLSGAKSSKENGKVCLNSKNYIIKIGNNCLPKIRQWSQKCKPLKLLRDTYIRIPLFKCIYKLDLMLFHKLFSSSIRINMESSLQNQDREYVTGITGSNYLRLSHRYVKLHQDMKMQILLVFLSTLSYLICLILNTVGFSSAFLKLIIILRQSLIHMVKCLTLKNH